MTLPTWQQVEIVPLLVLVKKPEQAQEEGQVKLVVHKLVHGLQPLEWEEVVVEVRPPSYELLLHSQVVSTAALQCLSSQQA